MSLLRSGSIRTAAVPSFTTTFAPYDSFHQGDVLNQILHPQEISRELLTKEEQKQNEQKEDESKVKDPKDHENDKDMKNIDAILHAQWFAQNLGQPFGGAHTGVAVYDLNGDGYDDLLFAAGRHQIDTAYALINLGYTDDDRLEFRFSDPLPLEVGSFYQIDVAPLSSLPKGHVAVLLAGGTCENYFVCIDAFQPALLLSVLVEGCSAYNPDAPCFLWVSSEALWEEPEREDSGNRNGAFSMEFGNGIDPAIVLVGQGGLSIFHPNDFGEYSKTDPDYVLEAEDKIIEFDDAVARSAGLAIGKVGQQTALVLGTRSSGRNPGPVAMVVVYQTRTEDGGYQYEHWNVDGDNPEFYANQNVSLEKTGVALADLNGDGNVDIISVRHQSQCHPSWIFHKISDHLSRFSHSGKDKFFSQ